MDAALQSRQALKLSLRGALDGNQFELFYQPIVCLHTGRVRQLEALLRWRHPDRGSVSPQEFVAVAEDTGLIVPIGDWVLKEACRQTTAWPDDLGVSVNLSPVQFRGGRLNDTVASALADAGLAPSRLELEVTESLMLRDEEANLATVRRLRATGVQVSIDDFGAGYSSLGKLRSFPFDRMKIDRSFIGEIPGEASSKSIVAAIIGLGRSLGIPVTAEGVEKVEQLRALQALGCEEAQGYLFGVPVPAPQVPSLMAHLQRHPCSPPRPTRQRGQRKRPARGAPAPHELRRAAATPRSDLS